MGLRGKRLLLLSQWLLCAQVKPSPPPPSSSKTSMALAPDGSLNMKKLQKEMGEALDEDVKHVKTDEMKKRAIRTARNYDEFKNLVACACLKPISREEIDSLRKTKKGWARHKAKASGSSRGLGHAAAQLSAPAGQPTSSMEFERDWRRIGGDKDRRLRLLSMCGASFIEENFKVEMDAVLLGEVVETLHSALINPQVQGAENEGEGTLPSPPPRRTTKTQDEGPAHPPPPPQGTAGDEREGKEGLTLAEVGGLMRALAKTGRFSLNKRFLSDVQLKKAGEIVEALRGQIGEDEVEKLLREYS